MTAISQVTLARSDGMRLAVHRCPARPGDGRPGILFLSGFASDMTGTKGAALEAWAQDRGQALVRFDYSGHGRSDGRFRDGTIGRWTADALTVLDRLTAGPQILVGSSMGGWIMLLAALARPARVVGLVGIAAAPDFTEDLMWAQMPEATRAQLRKDGVVLQHSQYQQQPLEITRALIEEGRDHLLLRGAIEIPCPVRLLHGMADPDVPWPTSIRLAERLTGSDVTVTLTKDGDHRLSREQDLRRLFSAIDELSLARSSTQQGA